MSIYATGWTLRLPIDVPCAPGEKDASYYGPGDDIGGPGKPTRERWIEVYFQHVPNHINEENGYDWDWLPAFVHKDGCKQRRHHSWFQVVDTELGICRPCEPDDSDAQHSIEYSCDCGDRCVLILDEDHEDKDGQRYPDPLLVLSGAEYEAAGFGDLLLRVTNALEARFGIPCGWKS